MTNKERCDARTRVLDAVLILFARNKRIRKDAKRVAEGRVN